MYTSYYGFREKPFQMTPDPSYLYMSRGHADTYTHLEYALTEDRGFVVITGGFGSGKTSLINLLITELGSPFTVGVLTPNMGQSEQFSEVIYHRFGLDLTGVDSTEMPGIFRDFLIRHYRAGSRVILIVDEAQRLTDRVVEEIRLLANLKAGRRYLLQIILAGQPELKQMLTKNWVRQFVQRVTVCCHLDALGIDEMDRYIRHRLHQAGGSERIDIFDHKAIESIYAHSRGIPRIANIISDAALVYGYADELRVIGEGVIEKVVGTRGLNGFPIRDIPHGNAPPGTA